MQAVLGSLAIVHALRLKSREGLGYRWPIPVACADKYEREAGKNWDLFYKRNADRVCELQSSHCLWFAVCNGDT